MKKLLARSFRVSALVAAVAVARAGAVAFAANLPSGFTELPYIESDGNQWIATTYTPLCTDRVEFSFRMLKFTDWTHRYLFGSFGKANNADSFILSYYGDKNGRKIQTWNGDWAKNGPYLEVGIDYDVVFDSGKKSFSINGETMPTLGKGIFTAQSPFILFGGHAAGSAFDPETTTITAQTMYRLYSFKVFDKDGNLKCDLVPAQDANATSGVTRFGVYDTVSRVFFKNRGTASFTTDPAYKIVHVVDRAAYGSDEAAGAAILEKVASGLVGPGDAITLTAGTKTAPHVYRISEPLRLTTPMVSLAGSSDDPEATVIDAGHETAAVVVTAAATACEVRGLTVRNAIGFLEGTTPCAGGIAALADGTLISNCVVRACRNVGSESPLCGSGVYLVGSTLVDSLVESCTATNLHLSAGKTDSYGGGVCAVKKSRVRGVEIRDCTGYNGQHANPSHETGQMYGAGLTLHGESSAEGCYVHHNEMCDDPAEACGAVNYGAGVALLDSSIENSRISANESVSSYAGVFLSGNKARVSGCSVASNVIRQLRSALFGAGIGWDLNYAVAVRDCLVEGNVIDSKDNDWDSRGAGARFPSGSVSGCVFRRNRSNWRCLGQGLSLGKAAAVSNCVIEANAPLTEDGAGSAVVSQVESGGVLRDCWLVRNKSGADVTHYGTAITVGSTGAGCGLLVRNCFFGGNEGGGCLIAGPDSRADGRYVFENCTFVSNRVTHSVVGCQGIQWPETDPFKLIHSFYFTNCLFSCNGEKPGLHPKFSVCANTAYCYSDGGEGFPADSSVDHHNLTRASGSPRFLDPAGGDWSLRRTSGLRDKGMKLDWMGNGSKKGVQDMGDGTWTERPAATITVRGKSYDVGVVVTRNNAHPRLYGDTSDIGCSEYYCAPGLMLQVR